MKVQFELVFKVVVVVTYATFKLFRHRRKYSFYGQDSMLSSYREEALQLLLSDLLFYT